MRRAGYSNVEIYLAVPDYKTPEIISKDGSDYGEWLKKNVNVNFANTHPDLSNRIFNGLIDLSVSTNVMRKLSPSFFIKAKNGV